MPYLPRVYATPTRLKISRPGVNAVNAPTDTPRHLAFDSHWTKVERYQTIGIILNSTLHPNIAAANRRVLFGATLAEEPLVIMQVRQPNQLILVDIDTHVSTFENTEPFTSEPYMKVHQQRWLVTRITKTFCELEQKEVTAQSGNQSYSAPARDFIVLVFKP